LVSLPLQPAFVATIMKRLPIICSPVPCSVYLGKISKILPCLIISPGPLRYANSRNRLFFLMPWLYSSKSLSASCLIGPNGRPVCLNSRAISLYSSVSYHPPCPWPGISSEFRFWPLA
jgi:hypothetical protein